MTAEPGPAGMPAASPTRAGFGFQTKILTLLVAALLATLAVTLIVVKLAVGQAVAERLDHELVTGERIWSSFYLSRSDQLTVSVAVLADDFGFKAASATGDAATVLSALDNHGRRIGADLGALLDPSGTVLAAASTGAYPGTTDVPSAAFASLHARAQLAGRAVGVVEHGKRAYMVALVPVRAPTRIGWVAMGRELDNRFASEFQALTGLHLMLVRPLAKGRRVMASSLPVAATSALAVADRPAGTNRLWLDGAGFAARATRLPGADRTVEAWLLASHDDVVAPFLRIQQRIVVLSVLAALLALLVAVLIGRGVSRPVARLALAARRIEAGDYSQPLPAMGRDELGELATAFNRMQAGIAERERHILHQAHHDGLTDLPNRGRALAQMQELVDRVGGKTSCAVLMLDLDRFKEINDTLGHSFGDEVLVVVAQRLRSALRGDDLLARLGGDEFLVVLEDADTPLALKRARALVDILHVPLRLTRTQVSLDASVGVAMYPQHGEEPDVLLRRADIAMYEAKDMRSGVALYEAGRDEQHLRQLTLMADLRRALSHGELGMVFQPKIDLPSGRVAHAEALVRWTHPQFGQVGPDEFVPLAERSGLIHDLTRYVLDRSLQQQRAWLDAGMDIALAVNISSIDLRDGGFPEMVRATLAMHAVPATKLILEITEGALMRDITAAVKVLQQLRDDGVRLSIDDFGTGHSSLAQLRGLPVDEIKIDKSFVIGLSEHSEDAVIVRSAIEIGHNMGLRVIAEGVEDLASLALLRHYGCDMVQGFLFTPPLGAADFVAWCARYAADTAEITC